MFFFEKKQKYTGGYVFFDYFCVKLIATIVRDCRIDCLIFILFIKFYFLTK
ncbi:MAG: hypothetical protein RL757_1082 [Bacteroidota bacterium]|jgi:hypothetical protein